MLRSTNCYFYLLKQSNSHTIYCRITVNGDKRVKSTSQKIKPSHWNQDTQRVKSSCSQSKSINETLSTIENQIRQAENNLITTNKALTIDNLLEVIDSKGYKPKTFLEVFYNHNKKIEKLAKVGEYAEGTVTKYKTLLNHTINFIDAEYGKNDLTYSELNLQWVQRFYEWFRTEANISHNTTLKYLKFIKKIVFIGKKRGYIKADPFNGFTKTKKQKIPVHLTQTEIDRIINHPFYNDHLIKVADCFLFMIYTGLAYSDIKSLSSNQFSRKEDRVYLQYSRTKTGEYAKLLLLPVAQKIYEKYIIDNGSLPVLSNQKMNEHLKTIATYCGIDKNLTTHTGRHTFSVSICLENGISLDTLQILLGHANKSSTAHYGRITNTKVMNDMQALAERL